MTEDQRPTPSPDLRFKKTRYAARIAMPEVARAFDSVHMVFGGTGAVGGTAILKMLDVFDDLNGVHPRDPARFPILVATGNTEEEGKHFTNRRLRRALEAQWGSDPLTPVRGGVVTPSGVFVGVEKFGIAIIPGLDRLKDAPKEMHESLVRGYLEKTGLVGTSVEVLAGLERLASSSAPFTRFLSDYRNRVLPGDHRGRFDSVIVAIPLPSLVAYQGRGLEMAGSYIDGLDAAMLTHLKTCFETAIRDDLAAVGRTWADQVIVAHTTSVGGMYDVDTSGGTREIRIRLGFAHSAQDAWLGKKQDSAERLTRQYVERNIKVFITAAAIGIDEVRLPQAGVQGAVPLQREVAEQVLAAPHDVFPGARQRHDPDSPESVRAGFPLPVRQNVRIFPPLTLPLDAPPAGPLRLERAKTLLDTRGFDDLLRPAYRLRSGENGMFTVANAEALYRVMRVASASELGMTLALVCLFGDDPEAPWFHDDVCYYTETDNARAVLDFLAQPHLRQAQLSGLEPMALQDLGSAKHQGELHTLALLILLHRLKTLDFDAIHPYVDVRSFDARAYFEGHSRPLTFDDVAAWDPASLAEELRLLVSAETPTDLEPLNPFRPVGKEALFPARAEARRLVMAQVLRAVWSIPSLGSPILFELDGESFVRTGYYVAPIGRVITETDGIRRWLAEEYAKSGNPCTYEDFRDWHVCAGGFVDLRPHAILCTEMNPARDLRGKVLRYPDEASLRAGLREVPPYSRFSTCGLLAVLFRLRALYGVLAEAMLELGTLQDFRWQMPRDPNGHILLVPGIVEALRMVSEGLEKTTGTERLDGLWGYERAPAVDLRAAVRAAAKERGFTALASGGQTVEVDVPEEVGA